MKEEFTTIQKSLDFKEIQVDIKHLQGKILTIVEASMSNKDQLKAVKDLVNKMFSEQLTIVAQKCFPELPIKSREEIEETTSLTCEEIEKQVE